MMTRHLLLLAFTTLLFLSSTSFADDERPNFVWIISEDNSKHFLKIFDDTGAETPNIEKLATSGIVFDRAFSNAPVCSVARTTLITSCYGPRIGTQFHRRAKLAAMPKGLKMFPTYLREAGYFTTNRQKKDYNAVENEGVWDMSNRKAHWSRRAKGQPFFHKVSFAMSHESSLHFPAKLMETKKTDTDPASVFVPPVHPKTDTFKYTYARYHDKIMEIDRRVGEVVAQLKSDGLLEDTFVFYFGDHGGVLPGSKGYANERGLHVPLVVRIPENFKHLVNQENGSRTKGFVSFIDFGPTLLNLAGVKIPAQVDGKPFLGKNISEKDLASRNSTFGYADRFDEKYDLVRTIRVGDFKYVRNYQPFNFDGLHNNYRYKMAAYKEWRQLYEAGKLKDVEKQFFESRPAEALYDLSSDPYETKNLATSEPHSEKTAELRELLQAKVKSLPDLSFYPESFLVDNVLDNPVEYGQTHKAEIAKLIAIADLSLIPFPKAKPAIEAALASDDSHKKYWALITCSAHGKAALPLKEKINALLTDKDLLVRTRALEFLCLHDDSSSAGKLVNWLGESDSPVETLLMLNTAVLLKDGPSKVEFKIRRDSIKTKDSQVQRRIDYFLSN